MAADAQQAASEAQGTSWTVELASGTLHYPAGLVHVRLARTGPLLRGRLVLRPDFLGCWRSRLRTTAAVPPHDKAFYVAQVVAVLEDAGVWQSADSTAAPVDVVGHSMGGAVAVALAAAHPGRVGRMVLVAPAGLRIPMPFGARLAALPLVGLSLLRACSGAISSSGDDDFHARDCPGVREVREKTEWSLRNTPMCIESLHSDKSCDYKTNAARIAQLVPACEMAVLPGVGHHALYEAPEAAERAIVDFLQRQ
eukprot:m51a1_g7871 hypothetical protein (253) ;mRNA; r:14449-15466